MPPIVPVSGPSREPEQETDRLARFLCRPIVFQQPNRVVHPPSWVEHIPFAFWIVEALRPEVFVELGTHSGNSYAGFAQAIQTLSLATAAYAVDTWSGDVQTGLYDESVFTEWAAYHDRHFSAFSRIVRSTFDDAARHFSDATIDLLHIDGCHTYEAASSDFRIWRSKLSRRSVLLLHDINVRERDSGAWRLWEELKDQFPSFAFLHGHGLGVLGTGTDMPEALQWLFSRTSAQDLTAVRQFFAQLGGVVSARLATGEIERQLRAELAAASARLAAGAAEHDRLVRASTEQSAGLARQTDELTRLRAQLSVAMKDLDRRAAEKSGATLRYLGLEDRLAAAQRERDEGIRRAAQISADLLRRLHDVEAESARSTATIATEQRLPDAQGRGRLEALRRLAWTARALGLLPGRRWRPRTIVTLLTHPARFLEARVVLASGLFDEAYYRGRYPDAVASRMTPLAHFVLKGASEGRNPNPLFDGTYYLTHNPDVAKYGANPLIHYVSRGAFEGRSPHPLFDVPFYLSENPDVRTAGAEPLRHFLTFGAADKRNPNPFFNSAYYLERCPDVAAAGKNPLVHYVCEGWRELRRPSAAFDPEDHLEENTDVRTRNYDPLAHYLERGRAEGRAAIAPDLHDEPAAIADETVEAVEQLPVVRLTARSLDPAPAERPTVLCLSHVMPWPPRAGNEYRIYRMLCWLRDQGYRVIPIIAPLPGETVPAEALQTLADAFSNAVLCHRDGRLQYVLRDVPDVLASLNHEFARPASLLLSEYPPRGSDHERQMLEMDRVFCHDTLITTALRLHQVLGRYVLLAEYIWMARIFPLISGEVLKVVDTHDVFSTKPQKVFQFGVDDLQVEPQEEARRLRHADPIIAIQDEERRELEQLLPDKRIVTAGVDFNVVEDGGVPGNRRIFYVASDNPINRKGLLNFLRFAWPQIRREVPDAELLLAGKVARALEADVPGVVRLGLVDDLEPFYRQCRVVINPAVAGTGLKIKTLEALGHLRPIVTWPNGIDGLPPELAALCVTVQDWFEFARRVAGLLATDQPRLFSAAERDIIVRLTSPSAAYRGMTEAFAESLRRG